MHHSTTANTSRVTVCSFMMKDSEHSGQTFLFGSSGIQLGPGPPFLDQTFLLNLPKTLVTR